jgi:universal stress protein A
MTKYSHVLVAIDVTPEASEVLAKARQTATDNDADLSVISVIRPLTYAYTGMEVAGLASAALNFEEEARVSVRNSLGELCTSLGVDEAHRQVAFGVPAAEIKSQAENIGADLIVVGSHGRHGLGLLLGSTSNAVLHGSKSDVLVVRVSDE